MKRNTLEIGPRSEPSWHYRMDRGFPSQPGITATVHVDGGASYPLPHVKRHSPTGMEMGYAGSGPADLALSILVHYFRCFKLAKDVAMDLAGPLYQEFQRHFIATADRDELVITDEEIGEWLGTVQQRTEPEAEQQRSYAALWDYAAEIRDGRMGLDEANRRCLARRNADLRDLRAEGRRARAWTLRDQLRPYWGWGDPCGLTCPVYYLEALPQPAPEPEPETT